MIHYENGRWGLSVLLKLEGSVFPKAALVSLPFAILACLLIIFGNDDDENQSVTSSGLLWAGYNTLLGFLIVFRTNQAYSRFWEGATLLHQVRGEWFNATSSVFAFCSSKPEKQEQVSVFQQIMVRLMSLLLCSAAHQVSSFDTDDDFQILDIYGIDPESLAHLKASPDRCETVLQWIQRLIVEGAQEGSLDVAPPILSRVFQELSRGIVNLNNVRKIKEVPFPFPYAQMLAAMMVLHSVSTPWMASQTIRNPVLGGILSFCVTCGFWSLHYIAQEIDQPFGADANDINIRGMLSGFNASLLFLTEPRTKMVPHFTLRGPQLTTKPSMRRLSSATCDVLNQMPEDGMSNAPSVLSYVGARLSCSTCLPCRQCRRRGRGGPPGGAQGRGWAAWCRWPTRRPPQEEASGGRPFDGACACSETPTASVGHVTSGESQAFSANFSAGADGDSTAHRSVGVGSSEPVGDEMMWQTCSSAQPCSEGPDRSAGKHPGKLAVAVRFAI